MTLCDDRGSSGFSSRSIIKDSSFHYGTGKTMDDSDAVTFDDISLALSRLEYASELRVMFEMLFVTGCRIAALDRMKVTQIHEGVLHWHEGKNTKGLRKMRLHDRYWKEIEDYRRNNRVSSDRLFGICSDRFVKRFRVEARPVIGGRWSERRLVVYDGYYRDEFVCKLKGLRKTYQTKLFAEQLLKWGDSGVALEMTSKKMRHSSKQLTAYHYIQNFEKLDIRKWTGKDVGKMVQGRQTRIDDYGYF